MKITKPMLSATLANVGELKFPVLVTPKLDGIRCLIINGKPVSRNFIDIPNRYVQKTMTGLPEGLDGELMINGDFNKVQSAIMSEDKEPDFTYHVFDYVTDLKRPYQARMIDLTGLKLPGFCAKLIPSLVTNIDLLNEYESERLSEGYEGIMIRSPEGPYKCGRATTREGFLSKLKRFLDSEAEVIGFEEQFHNDNEKESDNIGHTKRSSHKENLIPNNTLGSLLVRDHKLGVGFALGTGFDATLRQEIWNNREKYLGKMVSYRYQSLVEKPRFPSFRGFRDLIDL